MHLLLLALKGGERYPGRLGVRHRSGTGIPVVSTLGMAFYGQHPDTAAIIGMAVIASGIVIMNLFSKMGSEESEEAAPVTPVASMDKNIAN